MDNIKRKYIKRKQKSGKMFHRLKSACKENGLIGSIRIFFRYKFPISISLVYQKIEPSDSCSVPGLVVERYPMWDGTNPVLLNALTKNSAVRMERDVHKLFSQGCELWIGKIDGVVEGVCWSRKHKQRMDYFVPLKETDATILSCFVFPEYRGRGIYPAMLETMVHLLFTQNQIRNVYIDCKSWNIASARGIQKAGFVSIGKAIRIDAFGKMLIFRNKCRKILR